MYSIYTCMLKLHRQTYFDYPIHVLKNPSLIKYSFWFLVKKNVKEQKWFHMLDIRVEMFVTCLYINTIW